MSIQHLTGAYELIGEEQHRLEGELAVAEVEEVLERGAQEIDDHRIVVALGAKPSNKGNADTSGKCLVHLRLILELRMLGLHGLELDGNFFSRDDVDA